MKRVLLTRKHKVTLTGDLGDADEKILAELVTLGLVEVTRKGLRATALGQAKIDELKDRVNE